MFSTSKRKLSNLPNGHGPKVRKVASPNGLLGEAQFDQENTLVSVNESELNESEMNESEMNESEMNESIVLVDSEEDELDAAQMTAIQREVASHENGIIEEIYCENFMCHWKLRVVLCKNINFITGENGSGKSAIIAAIQICLGASAKDTHRGKNLAKLIRKGHTGYATVRVTLLNEGLDAFQPEQFGNRITVERRIRADGSGEYRLLNEKGQLVSKLRKDLDALRDHFNIQTNNPCAILNQETAKTFLQGNSKDQYKFFLQATDLHTIKLHYESVHEVIKAVKTRLPIHQKSLEKKKQFYQEAKQIFDDSRQIKVLQDEYLQVQDKIIWSRVRIVEESIEELKAKVAQDSKKMEILEKKRDSKIQEIDQKKHAIDQHTQQLALVQEKVAQCNQTVEQQMKIIRETKIPVADVSAKVESFKRKKQRADQQIVQIRLEMKRKMEEHKKRSEVSFQDMDLQLDEKNKQLLVLNQQLKDLEMEQKSILSEMEKMEENLKHCSRSISQCETKYSQLVHRSEQLEIQRKDRVAVYGSNIPHLLRLIQDNASKFTSKPIGPLGMYTRLPEKHKNLALAVELVLRGVLGSFLVKNGKDKALLDRLKRQIRCKASEANIIISKGSSTRYNPRLPEGSLANHAILNLIEITQVDVYNALIDVGSIESKLIFSSRQETEAKAIYGSPGNQKLAVNVSELYIPNGDRMVVRNGNLAFIPNKALKSSQMINVNVDEELNEIKNQQEILLNEKNKHLSNLKTFKASIKEQSLLKSNVLRNLLKTKKEMDVIEMEIKELLVKKKEANEQLDLSHQEEKLHQYEEESKKLESEYIKMEEKLNELIPQLSEYEAILVNLKSETKEYIVQAEELEGELSGMMKTYGELEVKLLAYNKEIGEETNQRKQIQERLAIETEKLEKYSLHAQECNIKRIETEHLPEYYEAHAKDIKVRIEREKQRFGGVDLHQLAEEVEEKLQQYKALKKSLTTFSENVSMLEMFLKERLREWRVMRKHVGRKTSLQFSKILAQRDFQGKLKFHHDAEDVRIGVEDCGKLTSTTQTTRSVMTDMKQLSGGERSFTQIALLLALGQSLECPFRIMDEFDVFMDSINRDLTLELLVKAARTLTHVQFIFVTPNSLSTLAADDMIKVQKLDPPRPC